MAMSKSRQYVVYPVGTVVEVRDFPLDPALNGQRGVVSWASADGKWPYLDVMMLSGRNITISADYLVEVE